MSFGKQLFLVTGFSVALGAWCAGRAVAAEQTEASVVEAEEAPRRKADASFGAEWQWLQGKAMPGVTLRFGQGLWSGVLETSLIWLTEPDPEHRYRFLGSQVGGFVMVRPLHTRRFELATGLGVDYYPLWSIHGDEWQLALAARASGHVWLSRRLGLFGSARVHALSSKGLELGARRDGSSALPVMFGTGVEWRLQ